MKCCNLLIVAVILWAGVVSGAPATQKMTLDVSVDARVELMSVIYYFAGNPEYSQPRVKPYVDDVNQYFDSFRNADVINLARELRRTDGISYDAPMSLAVHLQNAVEMDGIVPLEPRPEGVDRRWKPADLQRFLQAARQFSGDSKFQEFYEKHHPLYELATQRMNDLLEHGAKLDWFDRFFGAHPGAKFHLVLAMLNGGQSYGAHVHQLTGDDLYCILGVWNTDAKGNPTFPPAVVPFVVHEFCHSYVNPLIDAHLPQLEASGEKLFASHQAIMRKQAYATPQIMLRESLVRACVVRYLHDTQGENAADNEIAQQEKLGFAWTRDLSNLLAEYEQHRGQYKSLDDFMPRVVKFFDDYSHQQ